MSRQSIGKVLVSTEFRCFIGALSLLAFSGVQAAGFYISEVGTPLSLGTAGAANVTNSFGPDAAWTNPAGLVHVEDGVMFAGLQVIAPTMKFDVDLAEKGGREGGNAGEPAVVPSFYYAQKLTDGWHFGFGFAALQVFGDAEIDQTAQGVRFTGEFEQFYVVYLGGTFQF